MSSRTCSTCARADCALCGLVERCDDWTSTDDDNDNSICDACAIEFTCEKRLKNPNQNDCDSFEECEA